MSTIAPQSITWEEFVDTYKPITNHITGNASYDGCMFETYGKESEFITESVNSGKADHVWTILDIDGQLIVSSGFHYVDRFGYLFTENPVPEGAHIMVADDDLVEEVFVTLESNVPRSEWDPEDRDNDELRLGLYRIRVPMGRPEAEQATMALDCFHSSVAIACLDDFEISVITNPLDLESVITEDPDEFDPEEMECNEADYGGYYSELPAKTAHLSPQ